MFPPMENGMGRKTKLVTHSRKRFGMKRAVIESKLERWMR
jgi:hypothetical protein